MKIPTVGWAFFGLAVLVVAGYVLNRGLYIGSTIERGTDGTLWFKTCHYLYLNGVRDVMSWHFAKTREEAESVFCVPINSN
jgi:hypothetical protein